MIYRLVCGLLGTAVCAAAFAQPPAAKSPEPYPFAVSLGPNNATYVFDKELKTLYRLDGDSKLEAMHKGSRKYRTPLFNVMAMAVDSAGNIFFCDTGSMDVWRRTPDGKLTPLTGQKIARGIGPAPKDQEFDPEAAYAGKFDKPMGIALDADGNPVVADLGLGAIFRVPAAGGMPEEIAKVPAPRGIARDREGGFVIVSHGKDQLVRISDQGEITPIVKGSLAPKNFPHHVLVDDTGYIVSDGYAKTIWRVTRDGQVKPVIQGEPLINPVGMALESNGNILVMDPHAKSLFRVTPEGQASVVQSFRPENSSEKKE